MKPSLSRIVSTDWPALFAAWMIPIAWLVYLIFPYIRKSAKHHDLLLIVLMGSLSAVAVAVLAWRIARIWRLFRVGGTTQGRVTSLRFGGDRGRLEYEYQLDGRRFSSWTPVHKSRAVLSLEVGEAVEILVDKKRPLRAIVKRLYAG